MQIEKNIRIKHENNFWLLIDYIKKNYKAKLWKVIETDETVK